VTTEEPQRPDPVWRIVVSILLAGVGLTGLLASLCGGFFTLSFLSGSMSLELLIISVPSLLIGGGIAWLCFKGLRRRWARSS
jgi:hypothetical protein